MPAKLGRPGSLLIACVALVAAEAPVSEGSVMSELAGRYARPYAGSYVEGEPYAGEDYIEISPTRDSHARISLFLNFRNGHSCSLEGNARIIESRLVFRDPHVEPGETRCVLAVWREGGDLRFSDGDHSCSHYCGMRGSLSGGRLPYALRRPLRGHGRRTGH